MPVPVGLVLHERAGLDRRIRGDLGARREGGLDHGVLPGEPRLVLGRLRPLAGMPAMSQFQYEEISQKDRGGRSGIVAPGVLDAGPLASPESTLEPSARGLDLRKQALLQVDGGLFGHSGITVRSGRRVIARGCVSTHRGFLETRGSTLRMPILMSQVRSENGRMDFEPPRLIDFGVKLGAFHAPSNTENVLMRRIVVPPLGPACAP